LEIYEQSCAVDSVTKKCAGKTSSCRTALLGVMGTPLRTLCACHGSDLQQLYECLGWQRLLWLNPCVGEHQSWSQNQTRASVLIKTISLRFRFSRSRIAERFPREATGGARSAGDDDHHNNSANDAAHHDAPDHDYINDSGSHFGSDKVHHQRATADAAASRNREYNARLRVPLTWTFALLSLQTFHRPIEPEPDVDVESNYIDTPDLPSELFNPDNKEDDGELYVGGVTTEMLEMEVTTLHPTTTTVETTTIAIRKSENRQRAAQI
jgi:GDNF/GAS1 domain